MKITKILKALLIALSIVMIFSLVACNIVSDGNETSESESVSESESASDSVPGSEPESGDVSESEPASGSEQESDSKTESGSASEGEDEACKHANTELDDKCNSVCSDCGVTVAIDQHVAGTPDADDACNVKCANCGKLMEANKHTAGEPDANDNCNVKCTVCNETLKTAQHQRGDGKPDKNDGCKIKCPVCSATLSVRHGEATANWVGIPGVAEDGNLYESKNCVDCGTVMESRVAVKTGYLNIITVGDAKVAEQRQVGAIVTLEEGKNSGSVVSVAGWLGINSGVYKYVYRVVDANGNASAWFDAEVVGKLQNIEGKDFEAHIKSITTNAPDIKDYASNGAFLGGIKTGNLSAYVNQTVTIEFGAVPTNNQSTAMVIGTVANLKVACYHEANENEYVVDPADPQWLVSESCSVCGAANVKVVADKNTAGKLMFSPSYIASKKGTLMTENGLTFVRINASKPSAGEENFYLYSNADTPITGAAGYVAVLYRSTVSNQIEFFINSKGKDIAAGDNKMSSVYAASDVWQLVVIDMTAVANFDEETIKCIRFDYFNNGKDNRNAEDYVDVAFITFFEAPNAAYEYYKAYVDAYLGTEGCRHYSNDGVLAPVEGMPGYIAYTCNYCGGPADLNACAHTDESKITVKGTLENDPIFSAIADCALCGTEDIKIVSDKTQAGLHVFTPSYIASKKGSLVIDDNGLIFVRITPTSSSGESYFFLYQNAETPMTNVGGYLAIVYRSTMTDYFDFYIDSTSTSVSQTSRTSTMAPTGDTWNLVVQNVGAVSTFNSEKLVALRFDVFNDSKNRTENDHVDVAYIAFFASKEEAEAYYAAYVAEYFGAEGCKHNFTSAWEKADEEGMLKNTCAWCEGEVLKACTHEYGDAWEKADEEGMIKNTCSLCESETVKACTHEYGDAWVKGDEEGTLKNTCTVCDMTIVKACEHSFDDTKWVLNEETGLVKNSCLVCELVLEFACEHKDRLICVIAEDGSYKYLCDVCKQETGVTGENQTTLMPDEIIPATTTETAVGDALGQGKPFADVLSLTDPNYKNMPYMRVKVNKATSMGEGYVYIKFTTPIKNVGKYVAVVYRTNNATATEMFITKGGNPSSGDQMVTVKSISTTTNQWSYALFDFSAKTNWDNTTGVGTIRWDLNNQLKVGNYLDVAYIGFFNSPAEAEAFYAAYSEAYELDYTFRGHIDNVYIGSEKVSMSSTNGAGATREYDFADKNLTSDSDIRFQGWFLSSLGVESYTINVFDDNGEIIKTYSFKGSNHGAVHGAYGAKDPYNYGAECGTGATFDHRIVLSGCEGNIVNVQVLANTVDGHVINFINASNITVPGASAAE